MPSSFDISSTATISSSHENDDNNNSESSSSLMTLISGHLDPYFNIEKLYYYYHSNRIKSTMSGSGSPFRAISVINKPILSIHHQCVPVNVILLLIITLILNMPLLSFASSNCYQSCSCVYTRNKLLADCGSLKFTELTQASMEQKRLMPLIQVINLTENTFLELKKEMFYNVHLINLQRIYLRKASVETIHKSAFYKLIQLVELDLSFNYLKYIPSEAFQHIPKLKTLDLSYNQIEVINDNSFKHLSSLKLLSLNSNRIKKIDINAFYGLWSLGELRLSDNRLSELSSKTLIPLNATHSMHLAGNNWHCDCKLRELRLGLFSKDILVTDEPRCGNNDKVWTKLGLDSLVCPPKIAPNKSLLYRLEQYSNLSLQCSFYMDDSQPLAIKWYWQNRPITNNSEGIIPTQHFSIRETDDPNHYDDNGKRQKLRVSRLDITYILKLNEGNYTCAAKNDAGSASHNFSIEVTAYMGHRNIPDADSPAAQASIESLHRSGEKISDNDLVMSNSNNHSTAKTTIYGMILGILFGMFITALLFGAVILIFCRKRTHSRNSLGTDRVVAAESELEKLTASTISGSNPSLRPMAPSPVTDMINPIRKPPRLALTGLPLTVTGDHHQIWTMKRTSFSTSGQSIYRNDGDRCYCDTSIPIYEYESSVDYNSLPTNASSSIEPDLIHHQSTMDRKRSKDYDDVLLGAQIDELPGQLC
ncbi:uncharacterized protein LOC141855888 isoform X2 [Brevipalpus obovatus]|uniref:uncharacterized protein LOC141855888 isoform X2 n=1 Tax=Brevipalpus obovatus TaxID=246614 RepID=UPI003D9FA901